MPHLLTAVQASTVCKLDAILDTFLDAVAGRLAGTGGQAKLLSLPVLQSLDAHILAQLLVKTLQRVPGSACDMTSILDAVVNPDGTALGFTASLAPPSSFGIQRSSSVDIDGIRWELAAWPGRSHLTGKRGAGIWVTAPAANWTPLACQAWGVTRLNAWFTSPAIWHQYPKPSLMFCSEAEL